MFQITVIGGCVAVALALVGDANGTIKCVIAIITILGVTFIARKVTEQLNKDCSQLISMAGWSMAGYSMVTIVKNMIAGAMPAVHLIQDISGGVQKIGGWFERVGSWMA